MNKIMMNFIAIIFAATILLSCGGETKDCMASTQAELEVCLKDKAISDLATFYCEWSKIEADSKDKNDSQKRKEADNHTDAIQKTVAGRKASEKDKFRELTKGCKEHN